jgi:hypothetical protein
VTQSSPGGAPPAPQPRTAGRREPPEDQAWSDVGEHAIRYVDTKRHRTRHTPLPKPLADDLNEWFLASGRPPGKCPVFPAHDGGLWHQDDWRNWRLGRTQLQIPWKCAKALCRTRTDDPFLTMEVLYQLS